MTDNNQPIGRLVEQMAAALRRHDFTLVTAESCTGGMIAAELTAVAGSSEWFEGAFVTYRLSAKQRMVGVQATTLARYGAVSEPTAREMAVGALIASDADVSVSVTGIAGPGGGDVLTPVGTVWFAWALAAGAPACVQTACRDLQGDRAEVRRQAMQVALAGVLELLGDPS